MTRTAVALAQARLLWPCDDDVVGTHEAQDFARDFLNDIGIGLLGGKQRDIALELGAHSLEAFDLELQQSRSFDQPRSRLEAVPAIECMMRKVGRQTQAEKQNRRLPWPHAPIMNLADAALGYAAQSWWTPLLWHAAP